MAISKSTKRLSTMLFAGLSLALPLTLLGSAQTVKADQSKSDAAGESKASRADSKSEVKKDDAETAVTLDWQDDFDKALAKGKEEQKMVLVDVFTDWCVYCKKLDREVFVNPAISKYLAEKFIVVRANAEDNAQGEAFSNKFDAHAYPTILVFDYKGKEKPKARIFGYLEPTEFDTAMHTIVESKKYKQKHKKSS